MNEIKFVTDKVSIIIPVLNEVDSLPLTIESLLENGYPHENLEFLLVDGGSTDGTLDYIESLLNLNLDVKLVHNERVFTAYAMNLGIKMAKHEIILRADAHAYFHKNYILFSVTSLKQGFGDNVGGKLIARANTTSFSQVLAILLNSKLGSGGAKYKTKENGSVVDTVWCGCWYKEVLSREGMFDPRWVRNQDAELNSRFISKGLKIYSDPRVVAELLVRLNYLELLSQYFGYGEGRIRTMLMYPKLIKLRQLLPIVAVIVFVCFALTKPVLLVVAILLLALLSAIIYKKSFSNLNISPIALVWVVPIILGMNISWVAGCVKGAISIVTSSINRNKTKLKSS